MVPLVTCSTHSEHAGPAEAAERIPGRCAASQIASASATSFFCRLTKGFT